MYQTQNYASNVCENYSADQILSHVRKIEREIETLSLASTILVKANILNRASGTVPLKALGAELSIKVKKLAGLKTALTLKPFRRYGRVDHDDGLHYKFFIFGPNISDVDVFKVLDREHLIVEGFESDIPGGRFARPVRIVRGKFRTLVYQEAGLDI